MTAKKKKSGQKVSGKTRKGAQAKPGTGKKAAVPVEHDETPVPEPTKKESVKHKNPGKKSREKPEKKRGRPPVPYDENRHPEWVRGLASRGATRQEICKAMGISRPTLDAWRKKYLDFLAALQVGRNETVALLHNSLMKRATGFSIPVKRTETSDTYTKVIETEEYFPPETKAATILLVNLDPTFKTDRTQQEIGGLNGGPLESTIIILPDNGRDKAAATGAKSH
jgi:hypothetical protein